MYHRAELETPLRFHIENASKRGAFQSIGLQMQHPKGFQVVRVATEIKWQKVPKG